MRKILLTVFYVFLFFSVTLLFADRGAADKSSGDLCRTGDSMPVDSNDFGGPTFSLPAEIDLQNQSAVVISGTGEPNLAVTYQVIDNANKTLSSSGMTDGDGNFSFTVDFSGLSDGTIQVTVFQNGLCESRIVSKTTEKHVPVPADLQFTAQCVLVSGSQQLVISGTTIPSGIINFVISDGPHAPVMSNVSADSHGKFSVSGIDISGFSGNISVCLTVTNPTTRIASPKTCQAVSSCAAAATVTSTNNSLITTTKPVAALPTSGPNDAMLGVALLVLSASASKLWVMIRG